jgi:phenylacetate-coenzyme A ligase PaaK-like adenylate-forming protein
MIEFLNQVLFFTALFVLIAVYVEFKEVRRLLREIRDATAATAYYVYQQSTASSGQTDEKRQEGDVVSTELTKEELCVINYLRETGGCDILLNIKVKCGNVSQKVLRRLTEIKRIDNRYMYCLKQEFFEVEAE